MTDRFDENGNLKKKNPEDFVAGDVAAQESGKMKGSGAGGEVDYNQGEQIVGPAGYEGSDVAVDSAPEDDGEKG